MRKHRVPPHRAEYPEQAAARWALRCAEGLSAQEKAELAGWIAADPSHAVLLDEFRRAWDRFEPLAAAKAESSARLNPRASPRRSRVPILRLALPVLAAAAAIAFGVWWRTPAERSTVARSASTTASRLPAPCEQRTLADGTVVELNRGAELAVEFTEAVRRVRLLRGEASFTVTKDPQRPFLVVADAVVARAVGTVFNVRHGFAAIEVLVTEGTVRIEAPTGAALHAGPMLLIAGQHVVVAGDSPAAAPTVKTLSPEEREQRLAWQSRLLEFDDAPLAEIVAAFNRRNPVHLLIDDPFLAAKRMTASFRSDNVESFVRLLEDNYGIRVMAREGGVIELRRR